MQIRRLLLLILFGCDSLPPLSLSFLPLSSSLPLPLYLFPSPSSPVDSSFLLVPSGSPFPLKVPLSLPSRFMIPLQPLSRQHCTIQTSADPLRASLTVDSCFKTQVFVNTLWLSLSWSRSMRRAPDMLWQWTIRFGNLRVSLQMILAWDSPRGQDKAPPGYP